MSNEPPTGAGRPGERRDWEADAPDAWDEPEGVRAADQHARQARDDAFEGDYYPDEHAAGVHDDDPQPADGHTSAGSAGIFAGRDHVGGGPDDDAHGDPADADRYGRDRKPLWRRLVVYALALAVLFGGVGVAYAVVRPVYEQFTAPKDYEGPGTGSVEVTVEPGDTGTEIGQNLQKSGVVLTAEAFTAALADNPGDEIQPGQYSLRQQMQAAQALSLMRNEGRNVTRVTIREGMWKSEVYAELSKVTKVPVAEYTKAEAAVAKDPSLVGLPAAAKGNIEGYLFPATYDFDPGTSATAQLRTMVAHAMTQLRSLSVTPVDMERVMTIASLVEGEARRDEDRPKVARVIENRLKNTMPLQMDSTVNYAVQRRSVTTSDRERAGTSPYNTYKHPGLPPGPINNPGAESITAAQRPADGPWLYFVTVDPGTGETRFASTLEEHNANVKLFQQWCQAHPGKC